VYGRQAGGRQDVGRRQAGSRQKADRRQTGGRQKVGRRQAGAKKKPDAWNVSWTHTFDEQPTSRDHCEDTDGLMVQTYIRALCGG